MRMTWKHGAGLATAGMFVALGGAVYAQNNANGNNMNGMNANTAEHLSSQDRTFARMAAQGGLGEVESGQLATQKAQNEQVKQFGQRMVDDHTHVRDELKQIAAKDSIELPTSVDAKGQALKDKLKGMSGAEFDKTYVPAEVKDHEQDIVEFQKEANNGTNPDLKSFATRTLPTLQEHLRLAKEADQAIKSNP